MIALPGLCLVTGRHEDAKKILRAFAKSLQQEALAEASLWFFVASWKYLRQATSDEAFARETLLPALRKVVQAETDDTLPSSLESNALWFNALSILADFEARLGDPAEAKSLIQRARQIQKALDEGPETSRPEQVFALSLPFPLLPKAKAARVLAAIPEELYAPAGLLGPYLTALVRVHGAAGRKQGLAVIAALKPRLAETARFARGGLERGRAAAGLRRGPACGEPVKKAGEVARKPTSR